MSANEAIRLLTRLGLHASGKQPPVFALGDPAWPACACPGRPPSRAGGWLLMRAVRRFVPFPLVPHGCVGMTQYPIRPVDWGVGAFLRGGRPAAPRGGSHPGQIQIQHIDIPACRSQRGHQEAYERPRGVSPDGLASTPPAMGAGTVWMGSRRFGAGKNSTALDQYSVAATANEVAAPDRHQAARSLQECMLRE
jgi:hypothetical protein